MPDTGYHRWRVYTVTAGEFDAPEGLGRFVSWWDSARASRANCLVVPNGAGGVAIFPPEELIRWQEREARIAELPLTAVEVGSPLLAAARAGVTYWTLKAVRRPKIPVSLIGLGFLPASGPILILAFAGIFELWNPEALAQAVQRGAESSDLFRQAGLELSAGLEREDDGSS